MGLSLSHDGQAAAVRLSVFTLCALWAVMASPIPHEAFDLEEMSMVQEAAGTPAPAPATAVTFAPLEALKADVATSQTEMSSKIAANLKTIQDAEVKSAAATKSVEDGLDAEVTKRGEEFSKAVEASKSLATTVTGVEDKMKSDAATLSAAISKLDTAFGAQKTTVEEQFKKTADNLDDERKASEQDVKDAEGKLQTDMGKLSTQVSKSVKTVETAVQANAAAVTTEQEARENEDSEQSKIMAALYAKVTNLATQIGNLQQASNTPNPSGAAAAAAPSPPAAAGNATLAY